MTDFMTSYSLYHLAQHFNDKINFRFNDYITYQNLKITYEI